MTFLYKVSKKKSKKDELGNIILQLPKFYSFIGVFTIIGGISLLIFAFFFANENDSILASITSIIVLITGILLFAKGSISNIKITNIGITETSIFGKQKEIK